jgi:hypothetical protein
LCRLGVTESAKGLQIGTMVVDYIKSKFVFENKTGCRFLTVDVCWKEIPFFSWFRCLGFSFANGCLQNERLTSGPLVFENGTFYIIETTLVVCCRVSPV